MKRKLLSELLKWKDQNDRKPLILEGARQVGKTYLLEEFGRTAFDNVLRVNFQNATPEILEIFSGTIEPRRIIATLETLYGTKVDPERTLIFFDEIQDAPRAVTALKYFYEDAPEYHIAASGSLLGVFLRHDQQSPFPVGKVKLLRLEPLDFEEFLWAQGRTELVSAAKTHPDQNVYNEPLRDLMREYMWVGGMPEAVQSWVVQHDPAQIENIHSGILTSYRDDFAKYADRTLSTRIRQVVETLPSQFAKESDRFRYGVVREGARGREYEMAVEWLANAGLIHRVYHTERGDKMPLKAYRALDKFKLYFFDTGLFCHLAEIKPQLIFEKDAIFNEYNGVLAEQFVQQELHAKHHTLYYWTGKTSEVDFVIEDIARIIPIEVKSGENGNARSLRIYREKYHPELSVRLSLKPYQYTDGLLNLPLYKIFGFDDFIASY